MPQREPRRASYTWRSFNPVYGPWHRLVADGKTISGAEVVVMPDMDNGRYFWCVRIGTRKQPREVLNGHEETLEDAKRAARAMFDERY